jgi:UDP-N-acetylglucosamine acyltransferase
MNEQSSNCSSEPTGVLAPAIHPTAIVHPNAELAADVTIGPYAVIGANVTLGKGCVVGPHALVEGHTEIGAGTQIFHAAAVGSAPQDLTYTGSVSFVRVGERNIIREFVTVQPGTEPGSETRIGNDNLLMAYVHVAHNCVLGDHVILANSVNLAGHVTLEDWAVIGGITPVHQFVRVGRHSMVGGGSRVAQDIAPFTKVAGNPPKNYGLNTIGLRRRGFSAEAMSSLKKTYQIFFREHLTVDAACARIEQEVDTCPEVTQFLAFVRAEGRGMTR